MKGYLYNVGPIDGDDYTGVHTYSQVLFPFINECKKKGIDFTWGGETLVNHKTNPYVNRLIQLDKVSNPVVNAPDIRWRQVSNDLMNPKDYDFLFLQPRPKENEIESFTVNKLIKKFIAAKKRVFLYEQDMFDIDKTFTKSKYVTHLRPYIAESDVKWKDSREFLFSYKKQYTRFLKYNDSNRYFDFIYLGNVYGRENSFKKYMSDFNLHLNAVFGNWISTDKKRKFSSGFSKLKFRGTTNHNLTIPLLNASLSTLQILPDYAAKKGLMTARVFNSVSADTMCFIDNDIYGADRLFPDYLITKDGKELQQRIQWLKEDKRLYDRVRRKRNKLMANETCEVRVKQFKKICEELI